MANRSRSVGPEGPPTKAFGAFAAIDGSLSKPWPVPVRQSKLRDFF
ncbi:MAG: DUF6053 domain-containing protein [Lysobacter sp.]